LITISVLLLVLVFEQFVAAQDSLNFYAIKAKYQPYYDSIQILYSDSSVEMDNPYQHWIDFWEPRLYPTGDFSIWRQKFDIAINDFIANQGQGSSSNALQWEPLGPNKMPEGASQMLKGLGQIHYIAIDPNNSNNILACSPAGGLFRSTDRGENWVNAGTDKGLPQCGVSSVAYDYNNSSTNWFISTGNAEGMPGGFVW
jgi:hypothetical protein